jgi:DNA-directed RNA polymerase subunit beta'
MAYHKARKAKDEMDDAERRATADADAEAAELAAVTEGAGGADTNEGPAAE